MTPSSERIVGDVGDRPHDVLSEARDRPREVPSDARDRPREVPSGERPDPEPPARFDFAIIGAGSAGEAAAHLARKRDASVAVIDRDLFGGACPFWSCMPSKTLLHAASEHAAGGPCDWACAVARRDQVIDRDGSERPSDASHVRELEEAGAVVFRGTARLLGPGRVGVSHDGAERAIAEHVIAEHTIAEHVIEARHIVLAVGSRAEIPRIEGLDAITPWTDREATWVRDLPASLVILGAGPTSVELAQVFARFGVRTTLVASEDRVHEKDHPRNSAFLEEVLQRDGVDVRVARRATRITPRAATDRAHIVELSDGSIAEGHEVLLAVGRTFPLEGLGLETLGLDVSAGAPAVDQHLRIAENVYLVGDPAGPEMHTHLAHYQGEMAVRIALGDDVRPDHRAIPRAVYTDPGVASVGVTLDQALAAGHDAFEELADLADTATGIVAQASGHVIIVVDRPSRTLLGAFIAGPGAAEAIHEAVLAIKTAMPLEVLADTIHAFPTTARVMGGLFAKAVARIEDEA